MRVLIDVNEDKKQKTKWMHQESEDQIPMDDLMDYAIHGLKRCEDYCGSEDCCGIGACFCVRARMPDPSHYALYEELREIGKELMMLKILGNLSHGLIPQGIVKSGEK